MPKHAFINVYYDAVCPSCRKDRRRYERWAGESARDIHWCDVGEYEDALRAKGIAPEAALKSLHIEQADGHIIEGVDAYRVLMARVLLLRPLAWLIGLPLIKPGLRVLYDSWVKRRLKQQGRWS
ncbi:thiol-disulfide oxidoreductase DCC family protein [Vreelandella populi]|uniref:DUF393 domain-containing protein n=1 Tax=Vreelandella populi TaxID=2498858 RepID=A0A3S0WR15_9GAMM|nr:DUF393 domain-containing protein [Halomonas populi]RUR40943.1 DUF393 domain-containing protein [Halomonas populi]RUR49455.1 DUF393 domain-containing protein [Halomonas populi]RUR55938.1 DUF393 domain-containing protein [Halomonas populi]